MSSTGAKIFWGVLGVKLLALIVFLVLFGEGRLIWSDTHTFLDLGRNIFLGNGYSQTIINTETGAITYKPNTIWTPLYSLVLGFFDVLIPYGLILVSVLQAFAAAGIAYYMYRLFRYLLPKWYAVIGALFLSFEPIIMATNIVLMRESFFLLFLLGFFVYFFDYDRGGERNNLIKASLMLALAVYTKPVALYLTIFVGIYMLIRTRKFTPVLLFAGILFATFLPWMIRNHAVAGTYALTTDGVNNICTWGLSGVLAAQYRVDSSNWDTTRTLPDYESVRARCTSTARVVGIFLTEYPGAFIASNTLSALAMLTNDGYTVFFERAPEDQVKIHHNYLTPVVFTNYDWPERIQGALEELSGIEITAIVLGKLMWISINILALIGFIYAITKKRSAMAVFLLFVILYFVAATTISTGLGVGSRLRYPINPFLVLYALYAVMVFVEMMRRRKITSLL